jgi:ketosteroid isomerase-like protein
MADQYVDDATLIPPSGRLVTGRDAILAFWTPRNPDFRTLEHSLTTDRLVVTGDVAMEVGTWRQRGQLREEAPTESAGRYLVVWRRQADGTWRMQFDSWTASFPED